MNRNQDTPQYYRPYDSGEDTDADYDTDGTDDTGDTGDTGDTEDIRIRREEDPRYAIVRAAGPNFNTSAQQLKYMEGAPGAPYDVNTNISSLANFKYLEPPKTIQTTLYCVKSINRDRNVFPSPFNFRIKLPRVYKNVTKFQLVQLSFPYNTEELASQATLQSSFYNFLGEFGFSPSCISACITVLTQGTTAYNSFGIIEQNRLNDYDNQMMATLEVPPGRYSNQDLANQLTLQANNTPPFNIITYDEFKNAFKVTRDISMLFNEPGDNFQSKITSTRFRAHSKETIMNTYYTRHDIDQFPIITDRIAFNAYYYPVLKELATTEFGLTFVQTKNYSPEFIKNIVLNNFQGLDSPIYYEICSCGKGALDEYRKNYTFQNRNINKYIWNYDELSKRFTCTHETLHTSLKNDIHKTLNCYFNEELQINSLSDHSFNTLKTNNCNNNTVLDHLQSNLSSIFHSYFLTETDLQYNGTDKYSSLSSGIYIIRSVDDLHNDQNFTTMFQFTSTFGRQYGNYVGKPFSFTSFLDYHSTLSSYYTMVQSTTCKISTIHGNVYSRHHTYVSTKYNRVLPKDYVQNKSYTTAQAIPAAFSNNKAFNVPGDSYNSNDPVFDQCRSTCQGIITEAVGRYYSCLPVNTVISGLNYRLGLHATDTLTFSNLATYFEVVSTGNFDFFMRINPEMSFNNMDIAMPENYAISNETTGQAKLMYAKILTAGLGAAETSQTCIQNPIIFQTTLGKLDHLDFQIYLDDQALTPLWRFYPFVQQINEWTATFQIDEEVSLADRNAGFGPKPTLPIPKNPLAMPFYGITSE